MACVGRALRLPLHTDSRWIVDAAGARVKLACVNWYGAHMEDFVVNGLDAQPIDAIAVGISQMGFNCVRLPFSLQMVLTNPTVNNASVLAANTELLGQSALVIFDQVIAALAAQGVMTILNNHISTAGWCCSLTDGQGLWYTDDYPEASFFEAWRLLAHRYASQPFVVGADLRNELRAAHGVEPTWGSGIASTDWALAATTCGNSVLQVAPHWLIVVEGLAFATRLDAAYHFPITLAVPQRLVYSAHDYSWSYPVTSYDEYQRTMGNHWGFLLTQNQSFTAPVWLGEFGTNAPIEWWSWVQQLRLGSTYYMIVMCDFFIVFFCCYGCNRRPNSLCAQV
jgi:endoglucanase